MEKQVAAHALETVKFLYKSQVYVGINLIYKSHDVFTLSGGEVVIVETKIEVITAAVKKI
jgi:hypothetical protein